MKVIRPNCRVQFTSEDIDFITKVLSPEGQQDCLTKLLTDEESRDLILDDSKLFHAVLEARGCLSISSHFYFYVLVRRIFVDMGIKEREVADYVAEMLSEFSRTDRGQCDSPNACGQLEYFFEMMEALRSADDRNAFLIRAHIGNHSLFLSGIFLQRLKHRAETKGFPDLRYYEALGQANFHAASSHRLAERYHLGHVFSTLADRFHATRLALNQLTERLFSMSEFDQAADVMLRKNCPKIGI